MKEYELWLDESGEFKKRQRRDKKNQIIIHHLLGEFYLIKRDFSENQAQKLIGEEMDSQ